MFKLLFSVLLIASLLSACGGGGGGGSDSSDESTSNIDSGSQPAANPDPEDTGSEDNDSIDGGARSNASAQITGANSFPADKKLALVLEITDLANDDAVYVTIAGDEIELGAISVSPKEAIVYPSEGKASLVLSLEDTGLNADSDINIDLVTGNNESLTVSHQIIVVE